MKYRSYNLALIVVLFSFVVFPGLVSAQVLPKTEPITFSTFNATYHLSRDADNHSLLTTEEVILTDFPGSGNYYGITRDIPLQYQGRNVAIKVNSVSDAAGNPIPFKTKNDKKGNLVITTGDPAILLFGSQTFRINYQTRDVINTKLATDQFLLDINGRGWSQPFSRVSGTIHIPKSFASNLVGKPSCYIGYLQNTSTDCAIETQDNTFETVIIIKSQGGVAAQHSLIAKINFRSATFSVKQNFWHHYGAQTIAIVIILLVLTGWYWLRRK